MVKNLEFVVRQVRAFVPLQKIPRIIAPFHWILGSKRGLRYVPPADFGTWTEQPPKMFALAWLLGQANPSRKLQSSMKSVPSGDYMLQVIVTDKLAKQKYQTTSQAIDFAVAAH